MKLNHNFIFLFLILVVSSLLIPYKICQWIIFSVILIIVISFFYLFILSKKIVVERKYSKLKVNCSDKIEISFVIKNYSKLNAYTLYYQDFAPYFYVFENKNEGLITLNSHEYKKINYFVKNQNRGKYNIGPIIVKISDPLNLFEIKKEFSKIITVIVHPEKIKLITETIPGYPQGNLKINNICYEDTTLRKTIKEFKNGDEIKRINWRSSAKFSKIYTNVYENSYDSPFFVFLNLACDDYNIHNRSYYSEKAIQIAASIVNQSKIYRQRIGFASYGSGFPFLYPDKNNADVILDILSEIQLEKGKLNYDPKKKFINQLPTGTLIFIINENVVDNYFLKVEAEKENVNTTNTGALVKNEYKK